MILVKTALFCLAASSPSVSKNAITMLGGRGLKNITSAGSGTSTTTTRSSVAQLRRAAGGKSFEAFCEAVQGWKASEIDESNDNKSPVHMAAWKGCLENLQYLIETLECNIDSISKGEFSYGKTPIFFALTQSREGVVNYLLDRSACVKIVNNKGQSPLSIASSHLSAATISKIQAQEQKQSDVEWTNYRATHSDGLEYGDLDPRFLERQLRATDIATALAINPTTKEIRRGNFLRNNPDRAREAKTKLATKPARRKQKPSPLSFSAEEMHQLQLAWERLEHGLSTGKPEKNELISIIHLSVKQRTSWIPEAASRLRTVAGSDTFLESIVTAENDSDLEPLVQRLLAQLRDPPRSNNPTIERTRNTPTQLEQPMEKQMVLMTHPLWRHAGQHVCGLSLSSSLENGKSILSLRQPPTFINSLVQLGRLRDALESAPVIGIDAEWHGEDSVSTLQVAVEDTAWVIDLLCLDAEYQNGCRQFIRSLFSRKKGGVLLGFAIGHDVPRLQSYVGERLPTAQLLDLQLAMMSDRAQMPGLASCVRAFSSIPLSKRQQCSDWSQRPLAAEQVEYAGLDAAVLPFLLAEKYKLEMIAKEIKR